MKDSTDDLWFMESATDDDSKGEKQFSDGSVFANELDLASDADSNVVDSDSEKEGILPDEVSMKLSLPYNNNNHHFTAIMQDIMINYLLLLTESVYAMHYPFHGWS